MKYTRVWAFIPSVSRALRYYFKLTHFLAHAVIHLRQNRAQCFARFTERGCGLFLYVCSLKASFREQISFHFGTPNADFKANRPHTGAIC